MQGSGTRNITEHSSVLSVWSKLVIPSFDSRITPLLLFPLFDSRSTLVYWPPRWSSPLSSTSWPVCWAFSTRELSREQQGFMVEESWARPLPNIQVKRKRSTSASASTIRQHLYVSVHRFPTNLTHLYIYYVVGIWHRPPLTRLYHDIGNIQYNGLPDGRDPSQGAVHGSMSELLSHHYRNHSYRWVHNLSPCLFNDTHED